MRGTALALFVGSIFGAGLALSDMVNPGRVQAFLDIAGDWDPTLVFVLGAAVLPSALAYLLQRRMSQPVLGQKFFIPENGIVDRQLLTGAALFGIGWGLVGFCPGPAIAGLVLGYWQPWLFVLAMLAGMLVHKFTAARPRNLKPTTRRV